MSSRGWQFGRRISATPRLLADSQVLWSDCYAALALAVVRTNRIQLG